MIILRPTNLHWIDGSADDPEDLCAHSGVEFQIDGDADVVKPGGTVAVVGDGAVGLLGVLSAKQMGAERIISMSRHESRQKLAREFGATDIVTERGEEGVARSRS